MKTLLLTLSCLLILSCGTSKTEKPVKIKSFQTDELTVSYPNTWVKFGGLGYIYLKPKLLYQKEVEDGNYILLNKSTLQLKDFDNDIEKALNNYAPILSRNQTEKYFTLIKIESDSIFVYKIVSTIKYNFRPDTFKRIEFCYKEKNVVKFYTYQMQEDLFNLYLEDAMLIINSVK